MHSKEQINLPMPGYIVIEIAYRGPSMLIYNVLENIGLSSKNPSESEFRDDCTKCVGNSVFPVFLSFAFWIVLRIFTSVCLMCFY